MPDTVLVTGGTGFVAGWCISELLEHGYNVRATVRTPESENDVRLAVARPGQNDAPLSFVFADLTADEGWSTAMAGCSYVLHVASPLGGSADVDRDALVAPARDGTLRVLRAAAQAGVQRVVMTSAAATARPPQTVDVVSDETIWADPDDPQFDSYRRSKIIAERAAWDFMQAFDGETSLTTVLPGAVFGPILGRSNLGSVRIIDSLLRGQPESLPRLGFWITDVRDLAQFHSRAMTAEAAVGERFIVAGEFLWMEDIAEVLRDHLRERAPLVPSRVAPNTPAGQPTPGTRELRGLASMLGKTNPLSTAKARSVLGFIPRSAVETIVDCAESLLAESGNRSAG